MFKKDPFKDSSRVSDIDFGTGQSYSTKLVVSVPDNFAVEELPKPVFVHTADSGIVFKREIISTAGQVIVNNSININRASFTKEEYKTVKSFFDKIYALINEQVVLKRKE